MTPLDRPLFTWITLEHRATLDGRITVHYEPYLVLDRVAVNAFVAAVGARRWRILETLALLSEPDPDHHLRRVVKANIPDLLAICAGPDTGWSKSTMSTVIKSLEVDGYLVRVLGAKLGRGAGQDDTTWILADGLFALPHESSSALTTRASSPAKDGKTQNTPTESYVSQNLDAIPQPGPLTDKGLQISDTQKPFLPHEEAWMNIPSMEPMTPAAFLADDTTNEVLSLAVAKSLRYHGWTTDVSSAIRQYGLLRIAAFIWYAEQPANKIKKPGGYIRTRLTAENDTWPDEWENGSLISVNITGAISVSPPHVQYQSNTMMAHFSTSQVMEIFTSLPEKERERIRAAAASHMPADPRERADAWKSYLVEVFTSAGLLENAS